MRDYTDLIKRLNEFSAEHEMHGGITAEAADAIEELCREIDADNDAMTAMYGAMMANDAVPVVRCKDCKHSYEDISGLSCSHGVCVDCIVQPEFFCADGERKR